MREILWGGEFYITLQGFCVTCAVLAERERRLEELYRKIKIGKMIKKVIFMLALSMFCMDIMAQPRPGITATNHATQGVHGTQSQKGAPVTPATLLLLGLGGAVTGTMVYRNTKKN